MKLIPHLFPILLLFLFSCKSDNVITILDKTNDGFLQLQENLSFNNNDSLYIGVINDIDVCGGNIYISDKTSNTVYAFNNNMNYLFMVGQKGEGPGEFAVAPYLSENNGQLILYDRKNLKYFVFKNEKLISQIKLPLGFYYQIDDPIFLGNKIILSATNTLLRRLDNLENYKTILLLNADGTIFGQTGSLLQTYSDNKDLLFYARHPFSHVAKAPNNKFFGLQAATYFYQLFDTTGKVIKTYRYKPKYFKDPPQINVDNEAKDLEKAYSNYYTKSTYYAKMVYDEKNALLFVNYRSLNINNYYSHSFLDADNYLIAIDSTGSCIYDQKIEGYLVDVDNGFIYFLNEESPDKIVIGKYLLKRKYD